MLQLSFMTDTAQTTGTLICNHECRSITHHYIAVHLFLYAFPYVCMSAFDVGSMSSSLDEKKRYAQLSLEFNSKNVT